MNFEEVQLIGFFSVSLSVYFCFCFFISFPSISKDVFCECYGNWLVLIPALLTPAGIIGDTGFHTLPPNLGCSSGL